MKKENYLRRSIHLSASWLQVLCDLWPPCLLCSDGLYPQMCSLDKLFPLWVNFIQCFITVMRKGVTTNPHQRPNLRFTGLWTSHFLKLLCKSFCLWYFVLSALANTALFSGNPTTCWWGNRVLDPEPKVVIAGMDIEPESQGFGTFFPLIIMGTWFAIPRSTLVFMGNSEGQFLL